MVGERGVEGEKEAKLLSKELSSLSLYIDGGEEKNGDRALLPSECLFVLSAVVSKSRNLYLSKCEGDI